MVSPGAVGLYNACGVWCGVECCAVSTLCISVCGVCESPILGSPQYPFILLSRPPLQWWHHRHHQHHRRHHPRPLCHIVPSNQSPATLGFCHPTPSLSLATSGVGCCQTEVAPGVWSSGWTSLLLGNPCHISPH